MHSWQRSLHTPRNLLLAPCLAGLALAAMGSGHVSDFGELAMQSASVWQRLGQRLDEAGASHADLVKTTVYIVDLDPATYFALYDDEVPARS